MNIDWYEKDELPPVGTECEYIIGERKGYLQCTFVGLNSRGNIVIETVDGEYLTYHDYQIKFRPLCTETNKLIEQMMFHGCQSLNRKEAAELVEKGYRKVKLMSEDGFMQNALKYFEMNQFTVSQFTLIGEALCKLHSAGCRFIDQGD